MTDLSKRLRLPIQVSCPNCGHRWTENDYLRAEAADEIERLRAELERARADASELARATAEYRKLHDLHGDGSRQAGRAWDLMARAEAKVRSALVPLTPEDAGR